METHELDVRNVPPVESLNRFLKRFDLLHGGEAFVLVTDSDPAGVLTFLQDERPALFEWNPLLRSQREYRVEVARRREGSHWTLSDFAASAHRRLIALLESMGDLLRSDQLDEARARMPILLFGVDRQFRIEEELLYPAFAQVNDAGAEESIAFFRGEHRVMRVLVAQIADAVESGSIGDARAAIQDLIEVLLPHAGEEAHMLLSPIDTRTASVEDLVRKLQAY